MLQHLLQPVGPEVVELCDFSINKRLFYYTKRNFLWQSVRLGFCYTTFTFNFKMTSHNFVSQLTINVLWLIQVNTCGRKLFPSSIYNFLIQKNNIFRLHSALLGFNLKIAKILETLFVIFCFLSQIKTWKIQIVNKVSRSMRILRIQVSPKPWYLFVVFLFSF